jgi:hypothetical protein
VRTWAETSTMFLDFQPLELRAKETSFLYMLPSLRYSIIPTIIAKDIWVMLINARHSKETM